MSRSITKCASILLILIFITGQVFAGEISSSFSSNKLAPSLATDSDINPDRSQRIQSDIAKTAEPGAIGNGRSLIALAKGELPPRITLPDKAIEAVMDRLNVAIELTISSSRKNIAQIPNEHMERVELAVRKLVKLQTNPREGIYFYEAIVLGPEDYLLGFSRKDYTGLSIELIDKLAPRRLAQYIFHEAVGERGKISERKTHRVIYNEIQTAIFGRVEVDGLKKDLRDFIAEKLDEKSSVGSRAQTTHPLAIGAMAQATWLTGSKESRAWSYGVGTPNELARLGANQAHFNVSAAFNDGRAFEVFGHKQKNLEELATQYVRKSGIKIDAAKKQKEIVERLKTIQELLRTALNDATLSNIMEAIENIHDESVSDLKAKEFLRLVKNASSSMYTIPRLIDILINQTRFVAILAREGAIEEEAQALAALGGITSPSHKAVVSFVGRAQYEGSEGVEAGPRSIYLDLARLEKFAQKDKDGKFKHIDELRLWLIHEYKDLARGYHIDEAPDITEKINRIHEDINKAEAKELEVARKKIAAKANPMTISIFGAEIGRFLGNAKVVPAELEETVRKRLDSAVEDKLIEDYYLLRVASRINLFILQRKGEENPQVHSLIQNVLEDVIRETQQRGIYKYDKDLLTTPRHELDKEMCLSFGETTFDFQLGETLGFIITNSGGIGATDILLWSAWSDARTTDAIPNVAVARPGFVYELEDRKDGTTHFVHAYDAPHLTSLIKENRHVAKRIWSLKRDSKDNPIPLKVKNYTYEELKPYLDEPVAFTLTETVGFGPKEQPDSFNAIAVTRLQTWKGPDSGELNSPLFRTTPIVIRNDETIAPFIPVSVERLAEPAKDNEVLVSILGFEPLPEGKFADKRGYPTQVGNPLGNYQFIQQAQEAGKFLAEIIKRHPITFEPRRAIGSRQKELEEALNAVPAYPRPEPDQNKPGDRPDYRPPYRRGEPRMELPNPITIAIGKCDKGGKFGHDEVPLLFALRERELITDAYKNSAGKVNRELIAAAMIKVLSKHYDSLMASGVLTAEQATSFKEKIQGLLSNAQAAIHPETKEVIFPTELAYIGKALLSREDAFMLLERVSQKVYPLDLETLNRLLEEAYSEPTVYVFKKGDILAWRHWRESGDDSGFLLVMPGLRKYSPELHSLYKDIEWELVYSVGRQLGVYGLAQDLSEKGVTGNVKGSGIGMAVVETDASIAKEGLVLNLNDKTNAGAYNLPLLEYLKDYPEPVLVEVLDPFTNLIRYYNSKTQYKYLEEVLGLTDQYSVTDIWVLPDTELARKYPFLLDYSLGELSSEKLFLIFGRYKGKDDAALLMLKAFLDVKKYAQSFKKPFFVVGDNRGINRNLVRPNRSDQPEAVAHDGASLVLMLDVGSYEDINPETGEIYDVAYEFDKPEYDKAREIAIRGNRLILSGSKPFEGASMVEREAAEYNMAESVEKDLEVLGLNIPTTRQVFNADITRASASGKGISEAIQKILDSEKFRAAEHSWREPIIGGNWKMAIGTESEAIGLFKAIAGEVEEINVKRLDLIIAIAPSFVHLSAVSNALYDVENMGMLSQGVIRIAAQDVSAEAPGAFTGQVSAEQLRDLGVEYVIIGHSELRRGNEKSPIEERITQTSEVVNGKIKNALANRLKPIVAVGENLEEYQQGRTYPVIEDQLRKSLFGLTGEQVKDIVIAYEPVYAIGTGLTATPEQANDVQRFIRAVLFDMFGEKVAADTRIQYGGSVKPDNITALIAKPNIDGALVGGASLNAGDFINIIDAVNAATRASASGVARPEELAVISAAEFSQRISEDLPVRAEVFEANFIRVLAEHPDQTFILGIDTDIGQTQKAQMMPIYKGIDQLVELKDNGGKPLLPNLLVIRASGQKDLASKILKLTEGKDKNVDLNNVFVVARNANVDGKMFDSITGENKAWIVAIDDLLAPPFSYIPVFEAATLAIMSRLNADLASMRRFYNTISENSISPDALQDMLKQRVIYLLPKTVPFEPNELRKLYELAQQVHIAA